MLQIQTEARRRIQTTSSFRTVFKKEDGAIDLASIMVGIVVIGLIGGVIAATVFAVIPWTQDNAAKQQLDAIVVAESAYKGLSSDTPPALPAGHQANSYANSASLADAKLLQEDDAYCVMTVNDGTGYQGFARSASSNIFYVTHEISQPRPFSGVLPADCSHLSVDGDDEQTALPEAELPVEALSSQIVMQYKSDQAQTVALPLQDGEGVATWSDGVVTPLDSGKTISRDLAAGEEYVVIFEGEATKISYQNLPGADALQGVSHIGADTGVTDASSAFAGAANLTDVPASIPITITDMTKMFDGATSFNDPDIREWDVSNVEKMTLMFNNTPEFTQDLKQWDTSSVENMAFVMGADKWLPDNIEYNPIRVTTTLTLNCPTAAKVEFPIRETISDMEFTWSDGVIGNLRSGTGNREFYSRQLAAKTPYTVVIEGKYDSFSLAFNDSSQTNISGSNCFQSFDHWGSDTGVTKAIRAFQGTTTTMSLPTSLPPTLTDMTRAFSSTSATFDFTNAGQWDTSNVTNMSYMFYAAYKFNDPIINNWDTSNVTNMSGMFGNATTFNQSLNNWNTENVEDMSGMFQNTTQFNSAIDNWNTHKVTNMSGMFYDAVRFNHPLSNWNVSSVTNMENMFRNAKTFNQNLAWDTRNVENFTRTFYEAAKFNGDISTWNTSNAKTTQAMFQNAIVFNQPLNNWDMSKVTDMSYMFHTASAFNQPLDKWDTSNVTTMFYSFWMAKAFKQDISNWDVSKVTMYKPFNTLSGMTAEQTPTFKA